MIASRGRGGSVELAGLKLIAAFPLRGSLGSLLRKLLAAGAFVAVSLTLTVLPAHAATPAPAGSTGYDISWPQCPSNFPAGGAFGIVGVTNGLAFSANPCLSGEYTWASGRPYAAALYMNTGNPETASSNWPGRAGVGPRTCTTANLADPSNVDCAYNYGWNAATDALTIATANVTAARTLPWWLDVEIGNSWNGTVAANSSTVQGYIDYVRSQATGTVGIYSTGYQWGQITGGYTVPSSPSTPAAPDWLAGASSVSQAASMCDPANSFSGGPVQLVQYPNSGFDGDYVCGVPPPPPTAYTTQSPNRILDTRISHTTLGAGGSLNLTVAGGSTGVPASANGVVLNVTVTNTSASSLLTVWPAGQARPATSNLNWVAGETRPNLVNVPVGAGGQVSIYNAKGSADVVVDEEGYFAAAVGTAGGYNALSPARLLDTRLSHLTMNTGSLIDLQILGAGGVPATGVSAVVLNATATNTASAGLLTLYPSGTTRPTASNVNWAKGWTIANRVIVKVGANGKVSIYNAKGSADVVVDVNGYFTDATASGKFFTPLSPVRVLDTRLSGGTLGPKGTYPNFQVTGTHGVPSGATAVFLNTTVANTTASSALIVYPNARPTASDLNWKKGQTIPNLTLATLSSTGTTNFYNADGSTDLVLDLSGYFGP